MYMCENLCRPQQQRQDVFDRVFAAAARLHLVQHHGVAGHPRRIQHGRQNLRTVSSGRVERSESKSVTK